MIPFLQKSRQPTARTKRVWTEIEISIHFYFTADFHCYGNTVNNGWKVLNAAKNKWFVLYAETKEEKDAWLNEFIQERERKRSEFEVL